MKKPIAMLTALLLLALLTGCAGVIVEPATFSGEPVAVPDENGTITDEAAEPPAASGAADGQSAAPFAGSGSPHRATEAVTYSGEGIPIANAYFSLRLPADWDGHYLCETSYDGDTMYLRFRHRESADAGLDGTLFRLALVPDGAGFNDAAGERLHTLTDGNETYSLWAIRSTDAPFSADTAELYSAM